MKYEGGWDKSPSLLFSLDCGARCSGCVASTTLISSAFSALLNCAEVGRQNRILTNYRFLIRKLKRAQKDSPCDIMKVKKLY